MGNYLATYFGRMYISREDSDWDIVQHNRGTNVNDNSQNMNPGSGSDVVLLGVGQHKVDTKSSPVGEHQVGKSSVVGEHQVGRATSIVENEVGESSSCGEHDVNKMNFVSGSSQSNCAMDRDGKSGHVMPTPDDESVPRQCKRYLPDCSHQAKQSKCRRLAPQHIGSSPSTEPSSGKVIKHHDENRCVDTSQVSTSSHIEKLATFCRRDGKFFSSMDSDSMMCTKSTVSEEYTEQDSPIENLPSDLLIQVFHYLPLVDLLHRVSLVCKYWYDLSHDPDLWREVNLRGQMKVTDQVLKRVVSYSEGVISVDISDARSVTDNGLETVAKQCTSLVCLKLMRCVQLKEPAFKAVGDYCPNLVHLYLDCCFCLSDKALAAICANCPKIRVLHINQCGVLSNIGIETIGQGCPELEDLSMDQCKQVGDPGLLAIIRGCTKLRRLSAMSCVFSSEGIIELVKLSLLQRLELHDVLGVTDDCIIKVVHRCKQLEVLNLSLCTRITDRSVDYISRQANNLRALYLASCDLTDNALISLGTNSRRLETVDVGWCSNITDDGAREISERCNTLRSLGLTRCDKVTIPTMDDLVERYPHIHYSTFWLDCRRLMSRAQKIGLIQPDHLPC